MVIDYLTSAALVSVMKEIEVDGQKLTRQDQQAVAIDLINRALVLLRLFLIGALIEILLLLN